MGESKIAGLIIELIKIGLYYIFTFRKQPIVEYCSLIYEEKESKDG